jgi:hypothetical protein
VWYEVTPVGFGQNTLIEDNSSDTAHPLGYPFSPDPARLADSPAGCSPALW